jgi:hypothetical protein
MALYGGARDISMFRRVNRELMGNIISQEVIFYKYNVTTTKTNMYGESVEGRNFADPVILFALVELGDPESPTSDLGVDYTWPITVRFLRDDLISKFNSANQGQGFGPFQAQPIQYGASIQPAVGDVIQYENGYWEIDNTYDTQYFVGKDPQYPYYDADGENPLNDGLENFGYSVEVRCDCHYVPSDRLNIIKSRM